MATALGQQIDLPGVGHARTDCASAATDTRRAALRHMPSRSLFWCIEMTDGGMRVYLLEDSIAIRDVLVSSLESNDAIEVTGHADNVETAWRDPNLAQADAVIIDLALRGSTGFHLLSLMQSDPRFGTTDKIVLTNYATSTYRQRASSLGANHFFDKSLEFDSVITLLDRLAAEKGAR